MSDAVIGQPYAPIQNAAEAPKSEKKTRVSFRVSRPWFYQASLDLKAWRAARNVARSLILPQRKDLYQIYEEALMDNHLGSLLKTRRMKATNAPFVLLDTDKNIHTDFLPFFRRPWFEKFLKICVDTKFYGFSLIEMGYQNFDGGLGILEYSDVILFNRKLVIPEFGHIRTALHDTTGFNYRTNPAYNWNIIELGDTDDLGELEPVIPEVIWKRYARGDWAKRSEKFGSPIVNLKTSETDQEELAKKEAFLKNLSSESYMISDANDSLELIDPKSAADGHAIYKDLMEACNAEMSKWLNGQTSTSDQKAYVGAAEVHERILDDFTTSDMRFIQNAVNYSLIPLMVNAGYPLQGCTFIFTQFLKEYLNPGAASLQEQNSTTPEGTNPTNTPTPKKPAKPKASLANFTKPSAKPFLVEGSAIPNRYIIKHRYIIAQHINSMRNLTICCNITTPDINANLIDDFQKLIKQDVNTLYTLFKEKKPLTNEAFQPFLTELTKLSGSLLSNAFEQSYKEQKGSAAFSFQDEAFVAKARQNLFAFSGAKSLNQLITMRDNAFADNKVVPFTDFRDKALKINKEWNQTWLRTEYDSVIQSANMASKWQDIAQQAKTYPYLAYKTVGDNHVRPEHQAISGVVKPVNDSFWDSYYPPNGWNCRCTVEQLMKAEPSKDGEALNNAIKKAKVEPYFKNNVGKSARVFGEEHKYFKGLCALSTEPTACNPQDIMLKFGRYDAIALHQHLIDDLEYRYLEGTKLSENGAYLIHPKDWSKSDILSAKKCWPAMEKAALQFIGLKVNDTSHTAPHFDGILNGKSCELKYMQLKADTSTHHLKELLFKRLSKCNKQGAEIGVIVIEAFGNSIDVQKIDAISQQIKNEDRFKAWNNLKNFYVLLK